MEGLAEREVIELLFSRVDMFDDGNLTLEEFKAFMVTLREAADAPSEEIE